jgi:hypothetical protein
MLSLLTIIGCLVALYLARFPYNLVRNYVTARKMGLPIIIVPIDQHHLIWMLISVPLRPVFKVWMMALCISSTIFGSAGVVESKY